MNPPTTQAEKIETREGVTLLRPTIFDGEGILAAMSTRVGDTPRPPFDVNISFSVGDDPEEVRKCRERFLGAAGTEESSLAIPGQVHGECVLEVNSAGRYPSCDAVLTNRPGLVVGVTVADCVPILFADRTRKAVAAVHAGWRGSKAGIVRRALEMLTMKFASRPDDLLAYIGPSAGSCCYEVGEDVAAAFPDRVRKEIGGGKFLLDLKRFNYDLLRDFGMKEDAIAVSNYCTICTPSLFHSHRRDNVRSGRMMAIIGLQEGNGADES